MSRLGVVTGMPHICLTFDDGPDPTWTPRLLDLLADIGARATFFPIATRAARYPAVVARILSEGHVVGLHCDDHLHHSSRSIEWGRRDTARALALLHSVGVHPSLWRTPYGDTAAWTERVAGENELRLVGWTVDSHDWRGDSAAEMLRATVRGLRDGAIILAHDAVGPGALRNEMSQTLRYVELVSAHARGAGLDLEAVR
jgi:peptidoglycan-N-acetylglucosamine deacetylase